MAPPVWHLLQISDVLDLELASALAESVPVLAWEPQRRFFPGLVPPGKEAERVSRNTPETPDAPPQAVHIRQLPLLRGFARPPLSWVARTGSTLLKRLLRQTPNPLQSPLICTIPYFAPLAERWPGPVVYWLTDLIAEYTGANRNQVIRLDKRMCRAASLICPNSRVLADYLTQYAQADPGRIHLVPNATRAANLLPAPPPIPAELPGTSSALLPTARPIAGVIGNLAGNMDWVLLERLLALTPWLSWVFVGPTTMSITDPIARAARQAVMASPQASFVGRQPYGALAGYARSFDVAVLPYRRCEPTYSGSSTRFYEHLAACRPMVSTRGLEELTHMEPLLMLVDTAEQAAAALETLRLRHFNDDLGGLRWKVSRQNTWQTRALSLQAALHQQLTPQIAKALEPVPQRD